MAHKGLIFPVVTRRDFNLNVNNNNDGFARRYLVDLTFLPPGIGQGLLQGERFDCGPGGVNVVNRIEWNSAPEFSGVFLFIISLRASIIGGTEYKKELVINEGTGGTILVLQLINDPGPEYPQFPQFQTWKTTFRDPLFFTADGFFNEINAYKKPWSAGPPH